jgi:hypothetical protein
LSDGTCTGRIFVLRRILGSTPGHATMITSEMLFMWI